MKKLNKTLGFLLVVFSLVSCEYDGIDPITAVDPGPDEGDPQITISSPTQGSTIKVAEPVTSVNIEFEVVDDIEVKTITVAIDGNEIATFDEFLDYRIVREELSYDEVTNGEHTLTITATDMAGNTTTETVTFSKEPPYTPRFANEFFYAPYDGDFNELVTITTPEITGDPGFTSESFLGTAAYLGATDSYLTYPLTENPGESFTAAFWYKVSGDPSRAGILVAGDDATDRFQGFRLFREGSAEEQRIKLNVGTGAGESWNDGGVLDATAGEWVHVAFTVTPEETVLYFNGVPVNTSTLSAPIDWTGVDELTVGAGGETFSYWDHLSDTSPIDELRLFDAALTQSQIQELINASAVTLHMPFNGDYKDVITNREVTVVGDPGFSTASIEGSAAYEGAADSYLLTSTNGLFGEEISGTFWYNVNAEPNRAGILTASPEDTENAGYPDVQNLRTSGFRLFREGNAEEQRIKLNVGIGSGESWNDGGVIDVTAGDWVHVAFTISANESKIYLNGELVNTATLSAPIDWTGTDLLSIMSGAPRFTEWNHLADLILMDNLRLYNKVLTQEEIQAEMNQ